MRRAKSHLGRVDRTHARFNCEPLEGRWMLSIGDPNTFTQVLPTVNMGTVALPASKSGSLKIPVGKHANGGDSSQYEINTYRFTLPSNSPTSIKFVFSAANVTG